MSGRSSARSGWVLASALVLAVSSFSALAADLPFTFGTPYLVVVPLETFQRMPGADALGEACGATGIQGCTVFYARRLDCKCFPDEDHWHVHARAQFIPHIVLADATVLEHERMHIREVRTLLDDHLASLTSTEFHSPADCEAAARNATESFTSIMNAFQRQSNLRHHPMYVHELEDAKQ